MSKRSESGFNLIELIIVMIIIGIVAAFIINIIGNSPSGDIEGARKAFELQGYKNIRNIEEHGWMVYQYGCGQDDHIAFTATVDAPDGKPTPVVACTNMYGKGYTVRVRR